VLVDEVAADARELYAALTSLVDAVMALNPARVEMDHRFEAAMETAVTLLDSAEVYSA
jgi:phage tail protein X